MAISLKPQLTYLHGNWHHESWFKDRKQIVANMSKLVSSAIKELGLKKKDVSLVGIGMSGALSVPLISHYSKIPFSLIRHAGERTVCSSRPLVGEVRSKVIFIDDLVATGSTIRRVGRVLKSYNLELVGAVMLEDYGVVSTQVNKKTISIWTLEN